MLLHGCVTVTLSPGMQCMWHRCTKPQPVASRGPWRPGLFAHAWWTGAQIRVPDKDCQLSVLRPLTLKSPHCAGWLTKRGQLCMNRRGPCRPCVMHLSGSISLGTSHSSTGGRTGQP